MNKTHLYKPCLAILIIALFYFLINTGCGQEKQTSSKTTAAPHSTQEATLPAVMKNPVDGAEMILIPAGSYVFIYSAEKDGESDDESQSVQTAQTSAGTQSKEIFLDNFYIYKYEVTNGQFAKFCEATGYQSEGNWERWTNTKTQNYPVVMVSWNDAAAYCKWAGVRLPSEAMWMKSARGNTAGAFPWGDASDSSFCNNSQTPHNLLKDKALTLMGKTGTMPSGSFQKDKSSYGVFDMAGNVQEWCFDWYSDDYPSIMPLKNPQGPESGEDKVIKGGSYFQTIDECAIIPRHDNFPAGNDTYIGFRCVWTPDMPLPSPAPAAVVRPASSETPGISVSPAVETPKPDNTVIKQSGNLPSATTNPKDGAEIILIPEGSFMMGAANTDPDSGWEEKPTHKVSLKSFYMYKYEVTYEQFRRFVEKTGYKSEGTWKSHYNKKTAQHPVVYVTWADARAYCKWAGGDLPTEAQWEKAARGSDARTFPWGNEWNPDYCNNFELKDPKLLAKRYIYYDGMGTTLPGTFPKDISPFGIIDMGGNVIEWCRDWYEPLYYQDSPSRDPVGPKTGTQKVMRGGGWGQPRQVCRSGYRDKERPHDTDGDFGFRCVIEIEGIIKKPSN